MKIFKYSKFKFGDSMSPNLFCLKRKIGFQLFSFISINLITNKIDSIHMHLMLGPLEYLEITLKKN